MPRVVQPLLSEALWLFNRGLWVVPCDGKKPVVAGWDAKRLTWDELRQALNGSKLNIAIVLNQSDFIDVECDGPQAEANLQAMFGGKVPPTPTWQSKRGLHRLFRRPPGLPLKAKLEIDGIEFRIGHGKGALSVVPPSVHPDGPRYGWLPRLSLHAVQPAELPPNVVEKLRATRPPSVAEPDSAGDISEGSRNDELFKIACKLVRAGLTGKSVEAALQAENEARCNPPLPDAEVARIAKSAHSRSTQGTQNTQTHAQMLLDLALTDSELWHTQDDMAYATIRRDGHREHWRVRSSAYKQWLGKQFYDREGSVVGSQTLQDVINTLEGKARFDGPTHHLFIRVAGHDGRIYIDLTDDAWRAIEVGRLAWRIVDDPPVRFRRTKGIRPLVAPVRGGSVADLRRFLNVKDEDWPLIMSWLVAALRPTGPYPVLKLLGEQGSAKTTTAEVLRKCVDPHTALLRRPPGSARDLMIAANNGWVVGFDNMSYVTTDLSDALCSLATGGGFATRTLYTDDDETIIVAERPIILNGIEDIGTRSDLLDRSLVIELPRIESKRRRTEDVFWHEFEEALPGILGALLAAVSAALRNLPVVKKSATEWPRMADFAQWAVAAEPALGLNQGAFLKAYEDNRNAANQTALESSPVVAALLAMLRSRKSRTFEGTVTKLLDAISVGQDTRASSWPKSARPLSGILHRLAPNLRQAGVTVEQIRKNNEKVWRIALAPLQTPAPPSPSANPQNTQKSVPNPKPFGDLAAVLGDTPLGDDLD